MDSFYLNVISDYLIIIFFALSPSFIWLLFFLRKDSHPESNAMVLKIFFYGMLAAISAVCIEVGFFEETAKLYRYLFFLKLNLPPLFFVFLNMVIGVAFAEEFLKYLVVRLKVLKNPEFDEPPDVMLYMIISALGFVALENFLVLVSPEISVLNVGQKLTTIVFRFVSTTFFHALVSGAVGYFLARSFFETKRSTSLSFFGLALATILHAFYNLSLMGPELRNRYLGINSNSFLPSKPLDLIMILAFAFPLIIICGLAIFVFWGFRKLKKISSVCKIN